MLAPDPAFAHRQYTPVAQHTAAGMPSVVVVPQEEQERTHYTNTVVAVVAVVVRMLRTVHHEAGVHADAEPRLREAGRGVRAEVVDRVYTFADEDVRVGLLGEERECSMSDGGVMEVGDGNILVVFAFVVQAGVEVEFGSGRLWR